MKVSFDINNFLKGKSEKFTVLGLMSGTSLDGLDLAMVKFFKSDGAWSFELLASESRAYPNAWLRKLEEAPGFDAAKLIAFDREYGAYLGSVAKSFMIDAGVHPKLIASHGHTVFHDPSRSYTLQIGHGAYIAQQTGVDVVNDFRSADVANGGQGAPLVPIGDQELFANYAACMNLGGFSNISYEAAEGRVAFDICPVNIVLNDLAQELGMPYDENGDFAQSGILNLDLKRALDELAYYSLDGPKSLGREWYEANFRPLLRESDLSARDKLCTVVEHVASQISKIVSKVGLKNLLVTGGGAHNAYLLKKISEKTTADIIVPESGIVDYKEAIVFAFLGLLFLLDEPNCLKASTGAKMNSIGGALHKAIKKGR